MRQSKPKTSKQSAQQISFRLHLPLANRFERIVVASKRTRTSIIEQCLEDSLPKLEKEYAKAA